MASEVYMLLVDNATRQDNLTCVHSIRIPSTVAIGDKKSGDNARGGGSCSLLQARHGSGR